VYRAVKTEHDPTLAQLRKTAKINDIVTIKQTLQYSCRNFRKTSEKESE